MGVVLSGTAARAASASSTSRAGSGLAARCRGPRRSRAHGRPRSCEPAGWRRPGLPGGRTLPAPPVTRPGYSRPGRRRHDRVARAPRSRSRRDAQRDEERLEVVDLLTGPSEDGDRGAHLHLGTGRNQSPQHSAGGLGLDVDGGLLGLYRRDGVGGLEVCGLLHQPFGQHGLSGVGCHTRHEQDAGHGQYLAISSRAATTSAVWAIAAARAPSDAGRRQTAGHPPDRSVEEVEEPSVDLVGQPPAVRRGECALLGDQHLVGLGQAGLDGAPVDAGPVEPAQVDHLGVDPVFRDRLQHVGRHPEVGEHRQVGSGPPDSRRADRKAKSQSSTGPGPVEV